MVNPIEKKTRASTMGEIGGKLFGRSGSLFGGKRRRAQDAKETSEKRYSPVRMIAAGEVVDNAEEEERGRTPVGGQDKNRRRSRSRSIIRGVSQAVRFEFKRASSRSVSRTRPVNIDESILRYEKTRANTSVQLRLNHLIAGRWGLYPAWYLRIGVSTARGRLDIKDAIFQLKLRCRDWGDHGLCWRIQKYSPLKLFGQGTDVNYVDTRSTEVGAQLGREEVKGETKVSYGKERSYVQDNCYALELVETNNRLQAHLWRVGDASTVTPPSRFTIQMIVRPPTECICYQMEVTADLDINRGSEKARGSWRPVPIPHDRFRFVPEELPDFAKWKENDWMLNDNSELFESGYVLQTT
ncbi:hypothetical protein V8F33_009866 [Rhypophila sp. PSN 637]